MKKSHRIMGLAALLLTGCQGVTPVYVQADRLTHDAIAPEFRAYVDADEALSPNQRARRVMLLESWEERIRAGEVAK